MDKAQSTADHSPNLPVELRRRIVGHVDNHTLAQIARVSGPLSFNAVEALYRELATLWGLIQLLLEPDMRAATPADVYRATNPRNGFVCPFIS